eukprot:scaffold11031_cov120-Isochrysis_galbana.AAC.1
MFEPLPEPRPVLPTPRPRPISRIKSAPKPSLTGVHLRMPSAPTLNVCHLLRRKLIVFGAEATSIRGRGDSSSQGL